MAKHTEDTLQGREGREGWEEKGEGVVMEGRGGGRGKRRREGMEEERYKVMLSLSHTHARTHTWEFRGEHIILLRLCS